MKIGDVASTLQMSQETIRFYIKKGLIVPMHTSYQYSFSEQDVEDLKLIRKYKNLNFSLGEIHDILSLYRVSYMNVPREVDRLTRLLDEKRKDLILRRKEIDSALEELEALIHDTNAHKAALDAGNGVPLSMLSLLRCAACQKELTLSDATIRSSKIEQGKLTCSCGYQAQIDGGAVFTSDVSDLEKATLYELRRTLLDEYDAKTVTNLKKDEHALLHAIFDRDAPKDKIVLETNIKRWFFLFKNLDHFDDSNLFFISSSYAEVIKFYKAQLDALPPVNKKILFIAARPEALPIQHGCVTLWIDYMDSLEHTETEPTFLPRLLSPYLKKGARIHGMLLSLPDEQYVRALQQKHHSLPDENITYFMRDSFPKMLETQGYRVHAFEKVSDHATSSLQSGVVLDKPLQRMLHYATYQG